MVVAPEEAGEGGKAGAAGEVAAVGREGEGGDVMRRIIGRFTPRSA